MRKLSITKILLYLLIIFIVIQTLTQFKKGLNEGISDGRNNRQIEKTKEK